MLINLNIKLSHQKDSDYNINVDIDPERPNDGSKTPHNIPAKTTLGAIKRPDAERLKIIKHPELAEEDRATEAVMDKLEL